MGLPGLEDTRLSEVHGGNYMAELATMLMQAQVYGAKMLAILEQPSTSLIFVSNVLDVLIAKILPIV